MRKCLIGLAALALLSGCSTTPNPVDSGGSNGEPKDPTLLASGQIVRVDTQHSYQGETTFTEGTHAVVTLCSMEGMDAPCETLSTQRIEGVDSFPIPYRLEGNPEEVFSQPGAGYYVYYLVRATVYMGAGDELYIGDFSDNIWNEIDGPTSELDIRVSGLERCGSPEGGGACASNERP